jgi:PAS domain S-box-containing protein
MPSFDWHFTLLALPLLLVFSLSIGLVFYTWRHRASVVSLPFLFACIAVGLWSLGYALEISVTNLDAKIFFAGWEYIGISTAPVAWAALGIRYTDQRRWLRWRYLGLALLIPLITSVLALTTRQHDLIHTRIWLDTSGPIPMMAAEFGIWFWVHTAYSYCMLLFGSFLLLRQAWSSRNLYRAQTFLIVIGVLIPWISNIVYLSLSSLFVIDPTPIAFNLSMVAFAWAIYRFRFLDLLPIAYQKIVEYMPDSVLVLDKDNRIAALNPSVTHLLNMTPQSLMGREVKSVLANWQEFIDRCLNLGEGRAEIKLERPQRSALWFDVQMVPLRDRSGQIEGRLGILRDITDRKHHELALALARDEALSANHFKTQLLSSVSHDLQAPLTAIEDSSQRLMRGGLTAEQQHAMENVHKSSQHLGSLIAELLDHAQLEAGKLTLRNGPVSPNELANTIAASMRILAEAKQLTYSSTIDTELPPLLLGDAERLQQILQNLVGNAIKFTSAGSVNVKLFRVSGQQWALRVTDTGPGIPADAQASIFEPFSQISQSNRAEHPGFGLGLSIVKQLATIMGGEVHLHSQTNNGSTFTVILPLLPYVMEKSA